MSSVSSRLSPPIQVFILVFYFVLVVVVKSAYDNHRRNQRFEKYNVMVNEVAHTLEIVEKHAKETAQAVRAIEASIHQKKISSSRRFLRRKERTKTTVVTKPP